MSGSQFAPYEPEYIKLWRKRLESDKPVKPTKVKPKAKRKGKAKK